MSERREIDEAGTMGERNMANRPDTKSRRDVILYELNEVPWTIVDYYITRRPNSNLAELIEAGQS